MFQLFLAFLLLVITLYFWVQHKYAKFKKLGVPFVKSKFSDSLKREHFSQTGKRAYDKMKGQGPYGGLYIFIFPIAIVLDLDFIKTVCIKEFSNFQNKGIYYDEEGEPLTAHLFSLEGQKWNKLRHKMSPTFTSGKIKQMFETVVDVGESFRGKLKKMCENDDPIDVNTMVGRFTSDVIGSCAFGIESNSIDNDDDTFFRMGKRIFHNQRQSEFGMIFMMSFPKIAKMIGMKMFHDDVSEFYLNVVRDTISYRLKNDIKRNDFMDLLINMMQKDGEPKDDSLFTFEEIAAQAFIFFFAGTDTSSTLLTFCFLELCNNQEIQEKVRNEVNEVVKRHGGKLSYDAMMEMKYMDQVLNETLRKYPPSTEILRKSEDEFILPDSNIIFPKKTMLFIPVYAIHHDPEYYPEPEKFDPERFSVENVRNRHSCAFIPFGVGPRNCIGMRFAMVQAKIGLAVTLMTIKMKLNEKTKMPLNFDPKSPFLSHVGGIWINAEKCFSESLS